MPKILDKYVEGIKKKGKSESSAYAIATSVLQKKGILKKGTRQLASSSKSSKSTKRKSLGENMKD